MLEEVVGLTVYYYNVDLGAAFCLEDVNGGEVFLTEVAFASAFLALFAEVAVEI
jgi:hypothetical protein